MINQEKSDELGRIESFFSTAPIDALRIISARNSIRLFMTKEYSLGRNDINSDTMSEFRAIFMVFMRSTDKDDKFLSYSIDTESEFRGNKYHIYKENMAALRIASTNDTELASEMIKISIYNGIQTAIKEAKKSERVINVGNRISMKVAGERAEKLIWSEILLDIESYNSLDEKESLMKEPFWRSAESVPKWIFRYWDKFKFMPYSRTLGFTHWIRWCEALAPATSLTPPKNIFRETDMEQLVSKNSEWWKRNVSDVNHDISVILNAGNEDVQIRSHEDSFKLLGSIDGRYSKEDIFTQGNRMVFSAYANAAAGSIEDHMSAARSNKRKKTAPSEEWVDASDALKRKLK